VENSCQALPPKIFSKPLISKDKKLCPICMQLWAFMPHLNQQAETAANPSDWRLSFAPTMALADTTANKRRTLKNTPIFTCNRHRNH
jgi:hypothetical protein